MRVCDFDGCNAPHQAKGYCRKHYQRLWKHGTPEITTFEWTKGFRSYPSQHDWLREHFGKASLHDCSYCGKQAEHWAFIREWCPDDETLMGKTTKGFDAPYSLDPAHYLTMCARHHKMMDSGNLPPLELALDG